MIQTFEQGAVGGGPTAPRPASRSVFLYNLGAAQEFVGQARRTQDLWMGSFLISWLTWQAMKPIVKRYGESAILLPSVAGHPLLTADPAQGSGAPVAVPEWVRAPNLPNVFTAIVNTADLEALALEITERLDSAVIDVSDAVHERVVSRFSAASADREAWRNQWRALVARLGSFWASCEIPESGVTDLTTGDWLQVIAMADSASVRPDSGRDGFGLAARTASAAKGRRKQVRDFSITSDTSGGSRCTQCGLRGAVKPSYRDLDQLVDPPRGSPKVKLHGRIRPGDELCAVCLGKRLCWEHYFLGRIATEQGPEDHLLFPSSSTIATAAFKAAVLEVWDTPACHLGTAPERPMRAFVEEYVAAVGRAAAAATPTAPELELRPSPILPAVETMIGSAPKQHRSGMAAFCRLDGALLFESELETFKVPRDNPVHGGEPAQAALAALRQMRGAARAAKVPAEPATYYAIIAADGDNVGDWVALNGGRARAVLHDLLNGSDLPTEAYHRQLGKVMQDFAGQASTKAHEKLARSLYSGGDDVLILSALEDALPLAMELNEAYHASRSEGLLASGALAAPRASMSAVVLVVHRGEALSEALKSASSLLKEEAKGQAKRDALCVAVQVRGTAPTTVTMKWGEGASSGPAALAGLMRAYQDGHLSPRLIPDLERHELAFSLEAGPATERDPWQRTLGARQAAQKGMLRFLIGRHAPEAARPKVTSLLVALLDAGHLVAPGTEWTFVARAARIAQFMAREA